MVTHFDEMCNEVTIQAIVTSLTKGRFVQLQEWVYNLGTQEVSKPTLRKNRNHVDA